MAKAGHYSPENENFCRYFRLVNETAAKPLRKIIENTAAVHKLNVEAFLLKYKVTMHILYTRGKIQKHQFETMYPKTGIFNFENLDITLLCVILKNMCNVSLKGKTAYEDIRKSRNELCHNPVIALARLDYYSKFSNVRDAIKILLKECQDATFEADIEQEMKNIDESPVSISVVMNLFRDFLFIQGSLMAETMSEKIHHLEASVKVIYASVEKQPSLTAKAVQSVLRADRQRKEVNQMIEALFKQTEEVLNRKSEYVLSKQFFEAESMLLSSGSVVICGGAGEGKTNAAYEIMRRNRQENNCIQIHSPDDVRFVDPRIFDFVFIDDIFGNYEIDESKFQSWMQVIEKLQHLVNAKAINLIIATREIVLKECKKYLEKFSIFNNTVSLSSKYLSKEEKTEILDTILKSKNKHCTGEEIQKCVMAFKSDLGFPYTCVLFASDDNFFREGHSFFKYNPFMKFDVFTKSHGFKHLTLLFLWIKDATNPVALNRNEGDDIILETLSGMFNYKFAIDRLYEIVSEQCKVMDGVFVNGGPYGYQFTHNAVYQSIGYYFARTGYYDIIIKHSNLAFFMEAISVTEDHYRSDRVFIRNKYYQNLVNRIIIEVIERNHCREMAMHPCLTTKVTELLLQTLKEKRKLKEFFGVSEKVYSHVDTFLPLYLETFTGNSCLLLQQLLNQIKCSKLFHRRSCKICEFYLKAYRGACRGGNMDALKKLSFVKCDSSVLIDAAYSGNKLMYKHILKVLGPNKYPKDEKRALHIAVGNNNIDMYKVIRQSGCMPDSKCLMIALRIRNSALMVHILRDMHASDALHEDDYVKYIKRTIFSMNILETLFDVGLSPTKEDIVHSMNVDPKAVESILWDLKYKFVKVNGKTNYTNNQVTKLWSNIIKDPDLNEKLEEIGLLKTSSYLDRQVRKGNFEKLDHIIQQMQRNEDWDPNNYFSLNLLNLSLPDQKDIFRHLLNIGIIPSYSTLFKTVASGDISIVKITLDKMKKSGTFDPSHRGSKRALLQSTISCDIFNCLIDEGMKPQAYHFLYTVECEVEADRKIEVITNLYSKAEKCDCIHYLDKNVMQLALLGAFDDKDVYTCLSKSPFKLPSTILPIIVSRGSDTQVERFISTMKAQNDWPPPFDAIELSLEGSFYNPDIFQILMKDDCVESIDGQHRLFIYRILFECRMHYFQKIREYISILQREKIWDPNNIVLKCSLLESIEDQATCEIFQQNGVFAEDIFDIACAKENFMLQSYIAAHLSNKGHKINHGNLNEVMIKSLSTSPHFCTGQLLKKAIDVSDREIVLNIFDNLNMTNPHFVDSEYASKIIELSCNRLDIYSSLLEKGFNPTLECLLPVLKNGSYESFYDTLKYLDGMNKLPRTGETARNLVRESIKRDSTRFYVTLTEYGIKSHFEDLVFAINADNIHFCHLVINNLDRDILEKCPEDIDVIILKCFPLYKRLHEKGLQLTSSVLLKVTQSFLKGQIGFHNIRTVFKNYFSSQLWSFEDNYLMHIYELSKRNVDLFSFLDIYFKSEKESYLVKILMSRNIKVIEEYLNEDSYNTRRILSGVIRKFAISRKRLDNRCTQLLAEWIQKNECDINLKILSSVFYSDTETTLQILYGLSEDIKASLDTKILETALEEAIFKKKLGLYFSILKECSKVKPTTYCLLYSIHQDNDVCYQITLKNLPEERKTCLDPYYKTSLALCCQKSDIEKFKTLLRESKFCDTELLYEVVLCKNELMFKLVRDKLVENNQWDFSLKEYWIASAYLEADDNPSIKTQFELYYDDVLGQCLAQDQDINDYEDNSIIYKRLQTYDNYEYHYNSEEENEVTSEHEYEDLDSFTLFNDAFLPLQHMH